MMSISRILKPILKPIIRQILNELLEEKTHHTILYKEKNGEIEIITNLFFESLLKQRNNKLKKR